MKAIGVLGGLRCSVGVRGRAAGSADGVRSCVGVDGAWGARQGSAGILNVGWAIGDGCCEPNKPPMSEERDIVADRRDFPGDFELLGCACTSFDASPLCTCWALTLVDSTFRFKVTAALAFGSVVAFLFEALS
jgi:hypothetical protein